MDGPDMKRFLGWFFALPFNIVTCLLRFFSLLSYSLAAPHCLSPSPFISGTQIVKLHLKVWDWWQLSPGPLSIRYFLMISLTWPGCTRGPISWTAATSQRAAVWRCYAEESHAWYWTMSMVWLSYADADQWKAWMMLLWELIRTSSNKLNLKLVCELETGQCNCDL